MSIEESVKIWLETFFNLKVTPIPTGDNKTPDYEAIYQGSNSTYLIEVKEKLEDENNLKKQEEKFDQNELYEHRQVIEPKTRIDNIIKKATKQINEYKNNDSKHENSFSVIWFHCNELSSEATVDLVKASIYGCETVVDFGEDNKDMQFHGDCYYFYHSLFHKLNDKLDAVIISKQNRKEGGVDITICLNNYSNRYNELRNNHLCIYHPKATNDPLEKERNNKAYIVDAAIDRNDESKVIEYLKKKYKSKHLIKFSMNHFQVSSAIPHNK
ncbi:hypothetical protein PsalMR5_04548 (plasmid) [Piscirickettsia salmonis]|uniref:hypothetical protein n=1 Tax=Piscirickettsia salmonis TaxID=1238 RepID=UPI0012BADE2D|nr:hypothetical protein [Piscirickettsia salmonis]QGP56973.1 hypothetical protein PsalSR1_04462 [Piscirickettsia salmonis]QGP61790.1 hypothetical protein PsalBI1_04432 [Piscirickettsia salmonis]QGP66623.1 hypothetical protein PsalMR5_04548 [Piscirickettsia salmonis]